MTDAMPSLRPDRCHAASGLEVRIDGRVAVETLGRTGGHAVAETHGRTKQRIELDLLHRTIAPRAALALADGVKHFFIPEGVKRRRDLVLPLDDGEVGGVLHDPEVVPQLADHAIDRGSRVRQRQHADELREVGVRGGADEQAARLAALFARAAAQSGPRAPAGAERFPIALRGFVETPPFPAFATHDEIGQIAGGPAFVEPELSPAVVAGVVHESGPVEVVHVASRTGAHEAGGDHGPSLETPLLVQRLAMHQAHCPLPHFRRVSCR